MKRNLFREMSYCQQHIAGTVAEIMSSEQPSIMRRIASGKHFVVHSGLAEKRKGNL